MEVVVSIFIISLGMVGVASLVNQNIQAQYINKNVLVASQLAQEGLELVRNKRDENWLTPGNDWLLGAGAGSASDILQDGTYVIDYTGAIDASVNSIADPGARLYLGANNFYTHTSGATSTPFSRLITVTDNSPASSTIDCLVSWQDRNGTYSYKAETVLYDWK